MLAKESKKREDPNKRKKWSKKDKLRIILEGLMSGSSIAELCQKRGIHQDLYYRWERKYFHCVFFSTSSTRQSKTEESQPKKKKRELKKQASDLIVNNRSLIIHKENKI